MKKIDYQPVVFGTLCEKNCRTDRLLARRLEEAVGESVLLPFAVERRHLKNVVITMKLMDVAGLVVTGSHRKHIMKHIPRLDRSARDAGMVDTVARRRGGFVGYCVEGMALAKWRQGQTKGGSRPGRPPLRKIARMVLEDRVELLTSATKIKRL